MLSRSGIGLASIPAFTAKVAILQRAACLITDEPHDLVEVALSQGKKVLLLEESGNAPAGDAAVAWLPLNASELGPVPLVREARNPDGGAASAVARHLRGWLTGSASAVPNAAPGNALSPRFLSEKA